MTKGQKVNFEGFTEKTKQREVRGEIKKLPVYGDGICDKCIKYRGKYYAICKKNI